MKLKDIMSLNPLPVHKDQKLKEVVVFFLEKRVDGAPVVDDENKIIGLVSKTHIYRAIIANTDFSTPVHQIMQINILTGHPEDEITDVLHPGLGRLPVVDVDGLVGMITRTDLARVFLDSYYQITSELDTILNSTYNLIISVDAKGRIRVFNRSAEKTLGIKAADVIGKPILDYLPNSGLMETLKKERVEPLQKITLNGRTFVSNRSPIYKDGKVVGAVAVLQDISEMENLSRELRSVRELNEELDAIIESSFDGLYITDGNGVTLRLNKAFEMIMGINGKEFMGRDVRDIEQEGIVSQSVSNQVLQRREPVTIMQETKTGKIVLATGSPVYDKKGNIFRVVSNIRDITELNMLKQKLEQAQGLTQHYESELRSLRLQSIDRGNFVVKSAEMRNLLDMVIRLARVDSIVMITGESGTGKELVASTIHHNSTRKNNAFIKINCGAIPGSLLESELFGYEAGAFTGAKKEGKPGYFELAEGGTLFLDEIGDLPYDLQVKLLRVLQSREFNRVGGEKSVKVDVRIIAATNSNLLEKVKKKEFREDLYYRLNVIPVHIPPLRNRKEEIPALVVHFLQIFNRKYNLNKRMAPEVVDIFMEYNWPGNIRELENLIERLVVTSDRDVINSDYLPIYLTNSIGESTGQVSISSIIPLRDAVESLEKQLLQKAYAQFRTTREIGKVLKINASTVVRKASKYGIKQL